MVEVNPIRTERDYEAALAEIEGLMAAAPGTSEGDRLDVLVTLVQAYEAEHHAIEAPDPISLLQFVMEQRGLDRAALQPMIGDRGRVSEVMARKRPLTLTMIRRLQENLGLPAEILVRPYELSRSKAA
ncbi:MAG: transcriptional regulator [Alphaproteobacteria bacterium]|nr:MAG: transcriptional regulator [Alphaproteobacteria bacterium]